MSDDDRWRNRLTWSWAGAAVFVLSVCLGVGWATAMIMTASSRTPPVNDTTADLLSTIGGVLAGAITAFIGGYVGRAIARKEFDEREGDEPPT